MSDGGEDLRPGRDPRSELEELSLGPKFLGSWHERLHRNRVTGLITKGVVTLVGSVVMLAGVVMLVTPGPGIVALALGLAILSTEWRWADRWLGAARASARRAALKAMELDPAVRRRRLAATLLGLLSLLLLASAAVNAWGWPGFVVDTWGWGQGLVPALPDLPRTGS